MTVQMWGESPIGKWSLAIESSGPGVGKTERVRKGCFVKMIGHRNINFNLILIIVYGGQSFLFPM